MNTKFFLQISFRLYVTRRRVGLVTFSNIIFIVDTRGVILGGTGGSDPTLFLLGDGPPHFFNTMSQNYT